MKCDICSGDYKAVFCFYKGKCIRCGEKGYFVRNCYNVKNVSVLVVVVGSFNDFFVDSVSVNVVVDFFFSVDFLVFDFVIVVVVNEDSGVYFFVIEVDERFN